MSNIDCLVELADALQKDEFSDQVNTMGMNEEMLLILKEEMARERKEAMAKAVRKIIELNKQADKYKAEMVALIRNARQTEKNAKTKLENIQRATEYGQETGNYLPLVFLLDYKQFTHHDLSEVNKSKFIVPENWAPSNGAAIKPVAKKAAVKK